MSEGLAQDGGLYVPESHPRVDHATLDAWRTLSYADLAFEILSLYVDDIPPADLKAICDKTYTPEVFGHARQERGAGLHALAPRTNERLSTSSDVQPPGPQHPTIAARSFWTGKRDCGLARHLREHVTRTRRQQIGPSAASPTKYYAGLYSSLMRNAVGLKLHSRPCGDHRMVLAWQALAIRLAIRAEKPAYHDNRRLPDE
ncbi:MULTISPECIES: hypothetical protein [unclassified Bradyrhizobium]